VDDASRVTTPVWRSEPVPWDTAIAEVTRALGRHAPDAVGVVASPKMPNEDLMAVRRLAEALGTRQVGFRVPPRTPGDQDDLLIRADKNPNTRAAELIGLDGDVAGILTAARSGRIKALWVFGHDLFDSAWLESDVTLALGALETLIFTGTNAGRTSALAHLVLPATAWVERDGTFTNWEGRVQRFRPAVEPLGEALPEWDIVGRVLGMLGHAASATRAEHWFVDLAANVEAFRGMTYQSIGETGRMTQ